MMPRSRQHHASSSPCLLLLQLSRFFFVFFFLRLPSFSSSATISSANPGVIALYSWINSSVSPPRVLSDWNPSDSSPCNWTHIACDSAGAVTSVAIQSVPLALPLPAGLCAALPSLSALVVSDANLTGSIPTDLSSCSFLTLLDLSFNSLSGPIPPSLFRLPALDSLILNSNQLSGPVPAALGGAASLRHILLYDNRLSGPLPDSLGDLSRLESLRAGGNHDPKLSRTAGCKMGTNRKTCTRLDYSSIDLSHPTWKTRELQSNS